MELQLVSEPDQHFGLSHYKAWPYLRGERCSHGTYGTPTADSNLGYSTHTMKLSALATSLLSVLVAVAATPVGQQTKPAAFFLAGDSTTAVNGGWGDGFLATLQNGAIGQNKGHSGTTTVSFVAGGDWGKVLDLVKSNQAKYDCYVTIQFGHNDQVQTRNSYQIVTKFSLLT